LHINLKIKIFLILNRLLSATEFINKYLSKIYKSKNESQAIAKSSFLREQFQSKQRSDYQLAELNVKERV